MCFSAGFALAAAVEPAVLAPVASQPSVPFPVGAARRRDLVQRGQLLPRRPLHRPGAGVRGRLAGDFAGLPPGNPAGIKKHEHSVLTSADVEKPDHPTDAACAEVIAFLRERLAP
jgi:hypothetical protein